MLKITVAIWEQGLQEEAAGKLGLPFTAQTPWCWANYSTADVTLKMSNRKTLCNVPLCNKVALHFSEGAFTLKAKVT